MEQEFNIRLRQARKNAGLTQKEVSEQIDGLSQPAYSDLESGKTRATTKIIELAELFAVDAVWLATGRPSKAHDKNLPYDVRKAINSDIKRVPIRCKSRICENGIWTEEDYPEGIDNGFIYANGVGIRAYAMEAAGMSLYPVVRAGWVMLFDPDRKPLAGEFVHVKLKDGRKYIKELLSNTNDVLSLLSIISSDRLAFDMNDVEFISAFHSIQPPSAVNKI